MIQATEAFIKRIQIKQCLRRMLIIAVTSVDYRHSQRRFRRPLRRTRTIMPQDHRIRVRFKYTDRILKRLPFIDRRDRLRILNLNGLPPQSLYRRSERAKSAARRLKEQERNEITSE